LQIFCCDKRYSTNDPDTYMFLTLYENSPTKKNIQEVKVKKEFTLYLKCIKNDCTVCKIIRFDKNSRVIDDFRLSGAKAREHLKKIARTKHKIDLPEPEYNVFPSSGQMPVYYWKFENDRQVEVSLDELVRTGRSVKPELKLSYI